MNLYGNFSLSCNIELSEPDFPFSINQDPSYPEMWGSQATSGGHSFVSLPEGGCELGAELREAHLLSEKARQF